GEAVRLVTLQRGFDPRNFCLVAFGGAGPLHANGLAADLGIPMVLIPPSPGVASALGMLVSDLRHHYRATSLQPLAEARLDDLNEILRGFESAALDLLKTEGIPPTMAHLERYLEVRYMGQSWQLTVPMPESAVTRASLMRLKEAFDHLHEATYGYSVPSEPAEIVNVGMLATGRIPKARLRTVPLGGPSPAAALKGQRDVYFRELGTFVSAPVFDRYALKAGNVINGPAVIEEADSTSIVHPGYLAEVKVFGILQITRQAVPGVSPTAEH
ncbi:MAG: hydantoinase/oxoprolinase family protein, partial [Actinomycetota bacterium]|nr:hydantoinase/oxoprolinase family protein [Actinomycetota bacterium]